MRPHTCLVSKTQTRSVVPSAPGKACRPAIGASLIASLASTKSFVRAGRAPFATAPPLPSHSGRSPVRASRPSALYPETGCSAPGSPSGEQKLAVMPIRLCARKVESSQARRFDEAEQGSEFPDDRPPRFRIGTPHCCEPLKTPDRFSWHTKTRNRPDAHTAPCVPLPPDRRAWRSAVQSKKVLRDHGCLRDPSSVPRHVLSAHRELRVGTTSVSTSSCRGRGVSGAPARAKRPGHVHLAPPRLRRQGSTTHRCRFQKHGETLLARSACARHSFEP